VTSPRVSVVIPTFNRALDLERCLNALVTQTISDFEVLVCDDGSTDNTAEIVQKFNGLLDIHYDYATNFGGPARPRNRGIKLARANYIAFLDSDDWWLPTKLEKSLAFLEAGADLVFHDLWNVTQADQTTFKSRIKSNQPSSSVYESLLCSGVAIPNSSIVVRAAILRSIGDINESKEIVAVEDFDMLLRVAQKTDRFVKIDECLGFYWNGGGNISAASSKNIQRTRAVYQLHLHNLKPAQRVRAESLLAYRIGRIAYLHSDWVTAVSHLKSALVGSISMVLRLKTMYCLAVAKINSKIHARS
jgi:glycosyltransferase involved in cell wall biosynthesis